MGREGATLPVDGHYLVRLAALTIILFFVDATATSQAGTVCHFSRVSHALWAATDNSIVLIEEGSYSEDLDFSSAVRIRANNVTLLAQGQVVLQGSGGDQWLVVAAPLFTIDGSLTLVDRAISISEGSTLVQKGSLHISVTAALRSGIKVDSGATWVQEGSVTITSGNLAEAQISLSNGIHLESTGKWHQYGELTLLAHGAIGVLAYGLWNQTGPATLTVVGEVDGRPGHHKGVFGEGVRLAGQATWNQWGPLSISAINASTVVYVSSSSLWLQNDSAVMTLDSPIAGVRLAGAWQQDGDSTISVVCGDHALPFDDNRCAGVLTSSTGTSQWVQKGALDMTLSGPKAIGVEGDTLEWHSIGRRSFETHNQATETDTSPLKASFFATTTARRRDTSPEVPDGTRDEEAGEHVYDVVKVQMFMVEPPRGNSTAMELWRMLYPNGRSLEAFGSEGGSHYRLCASTAHKLGSNEAAYRLTGFRMHTAPCVYAHLEPVAEPAAQHQAGLRWRRGLSAGAWSLGLRKVLVLRTAFLNDPTLTATASLFPTMVTDLAAAVERMSSGRATLQIRYDPDCIYVLDFTLAQVNSFPSTSLSFLLSAKQKAEVHPIEACRIDSVEWATFKHYITCLPPSNLPYAGVAAMPGNNLVLNGDQGLWIGTATHELGHNMGLPHASRVDVVAQSDWYEYGNPYDTMASSEGTFPVFLAGYQDVMGWIPTKVSYPVDAYTIDDGPPTVATYTLPPIHEANGDRLKTVRIPTVSATYGHYDNWIYLSWFNQASPSIARGVLITEDSHSLYTDGSKTGSTSERSFLIDAAPGTLSLRDGMVTADAPYVYGMGGRAPVLIEVTASQATADGLPIRITRLRPSGERMEGRGCTIAGCQSGADVPVLQCGQTLTWPSRTVVVRLDSSVHQAAVVSVSQCNSELGVFRVFPAGQHYYGSPPRVGADDATYDGCLGIEVPVGPNEPIWAAVSSSASQTTFSLTCGSMMPNTRRRLRFDDTGAGLSGVYELIGPKAWLGNEHVANYERRLTYDTQWRGDIHRLYSDSAQYGFLTIVSEQSESPVQWNGRALTNDRTATIRVRHACPRGMFSPAENQCAACPLYMTTERAGAVAISECKCRPGHSRDANGNCQPCPANTYSANGATCRACPNGGTSPPRSKLVSYCRPRLPAGYCSRFVIANMTTVWYGNEMDGVYEWDGLSVSDFPTYRQTTLCLGPWAHRTIFRNCATAALQFPIALWTGGQSPPQTWTSGMVFSYDTATGGFNTHDEGLLFNQPGYPPLSITCLPEPNEQERAPEWVDPPQELVLSGDAGDIPMGTYALVGTNYTAPVYALNGMYLAWHSPTRTWGFTQAPDLDGTQRWAFAGPMAGQLPVGSALAVRVFDAASQSFALAASIMINTSTGQAASPSASRTATPSVSPSRSASPTPSATSTRSPAAPASSSPSPTRSATAVGSATSTPTSPPAQVSPATQSPTPSPTRSPSTQSPTPSVTRSPSSPSSTPSTSPFSSPSPMLTPSQGGFAVDASRGGDGVSPLVGVAVAVPVALLVAAAVAVVALVLVWKYRQSLKAPDPLRRRTSVTSSSSTPLHDTPIVKQQVNDLYSPHDWDFVHGGSS